VTGCFLPALILLNFFFGWMFFRPLVWLGIEGILILLFVVNFYIIAKRVTSSPTTARGEDIVDVEGEVVEDKDNHA